MSTAGNRAATAQRRSRGFTTVLIIVYGVFALSATARSLVQILRDFDAAPLAYALSLLAALTYILVTVALARGGRSSHAALLLVLVELIGVVAVGTLSLLAPALFPDATVWSEFGSGYGYVPLLLPVLAILYLLRKRRRPEDGAPSGVL